MKNLQVLYNLYKTHDGKVSDKWNSYLNAYEKFFQTYQFGPINLLEIGIQNGGSLEIYSKYFSDAKNIVGVDINPKCSDLSFSDGRIKVIIDNSASQSCLDKIIKINPCYDIIIDDGSHTSRDIFCNFMLYFPLLNDDGIYCIEDLHCSYWEEFGGGLFHPYSSYSFIKTLIDIVNCGNIGMDINEIGLLGDFFEYYDLRPDLKALKSISSITIKNSLCVIEKSSAGHELGARFVSGNDESVFSGVLDRNNSEMIVPSQKNNIWTAAYIVNNVLSGVPDSSNDQFQTNLKTNDGNRLHIFREVTRKESCLNDEIYKLKKIISDYEQEIRRLANNCIDSQSLLEERAEEIRKLCERVISAEASLAERDIELAKLLK